MAGARFSFHLVLHFPHGSLASRKYPRGSGSLVIGFTLFVIRLNKPVTSLYGCNTTPEHSGSAHQLKTLQLTYSCTPSYTKELGTFHAHVATQQPTFYQRNDASFESLIQKVLSDSGVKGVAIKLARGVPTPRRTRYPTSTPEQHTRPVHPLRGRHLVVPYFFGSDDPSGGDIEDRSAKSTVAGVQALYDGWKARHTFSFTQKTVDKTSTYSSSTALLVVMDTFLTPLEAVKKRAKWVPPAELTLSFAHKMLVELSDEVSDAVMGTFSVGVTESKHEAVSLLSWWSETFYSCYVRDAELVDAEGRERLLRLYEDLWMLAIGDEDAVVRVTALEKLRKASDFVQVPVQR
ncbi:hypothetical protein C8J57DRAFT_1255954 [Mycena rebaudengoi]|nr:hypothetical protein C8J57DRAFT_1255954 [Mycena rebaudengoi]